MKIAHVFFLSAAILTLPSGILRWRGFKYLNQQRVHTGQVVFYLKCSIGR